MPRRAPPRLLVMTLAAMQFAACNREAQPTIADQFTDAVANEPVERVLELLDGGASPSAPDRFGALPLNVAVRYHRDSTVAELLAAGANPSVRDADSLTAWDRLFEDGEPGTAEVMLRDAIQRAGGGTAVTEWMRAVREGTAAPAWPTVLSGEILSLGMMYAALHDDGATLSTMRRGREMPNSSGYHALALAARFDRRRAVSALLEIDVHPDVESRALRHTTPLYWAAYAGHREVAGYLLRAGAEPDRPMVGGLRPIEAARSRGMSEMVTLLEGRIDP